MSTVNMGLPLNRPLKPKNYVPLAVLFLVLQAVCIKLFPAHEMASSYPFMVLAPWLALAACWWRARAEANRTRLLWALLCVALAIWAVGILFAAWEDLSQTNPMTGASFSDFLFFAYGMPLLLAISSPTEGKRNSPFLWLDALQVLMTAFLTYVTLFSAMPFSHGSTHPISESLLVVTYNVESFALAGAATLRLLTYAHGGRERRFYKVLCGYLWIYALLIALYNRITVMTNEQTGLYDLLSTIPFVFLVLGAVYPYARHEETLQPSRPKPLAMFIENGCPLFFTLALLALGAALIRQHFYLGMSGIVVALAVYGVRATLLQSRYMQAQHELQVARDKMEEMSLTDGLTGLANRRSFDTTIDVEWRRAVRLQIPLSLLMIDVDCFKNLNDKYGHPRGDDCLIRIGRALHASLPRSADLLARYGGEEFAVILSATDVFGAETVARRMLDCIRELSFSNESPIGKFVTISIGVATYQFPNEDSTASLIRAADGALYLAKRNGRDRIEYALSAVLSQAD